MEKGRSEKNDRTLLHEAAESGRPWLVHTLLRQNADPNKQDSGGETPLHLACRMAASGANSVVAEVLLADSRTDLNVKR